MVKSIIIAGSGGQGILLLGRLIASASMLKGKNVTYFPSYGAEIRGGSANCTVVVSDDTIGSPAVCSPDTLIVFNRSSLERFVYRLKEGGILFYDTSLIKDGRAGGPGLIRQTTDFCPVGVEASGEAARLGSIRYANMVMFGAFLRITKLSDISKSEKALRAIMSERHHTFIPENLKAIKRGYELSN